MILAAAARREVIGDTLGSGDRVGSGLAETRELGVGDVGVEPLSTGLGVGKGTVEALGTGSGVAGFGSAVGVGLVVEVAGGTAVGEAVEGEAVEGEAVEGEAVEGEARVADF